MCVCVYSYIKNDRHALIDGLLLEVILQRSLGIKKRPIVGKPTDEYSEFWRLGSLEDPGACAPTNAGFLKQRHRDST